VQQSLYNKKSPKKKRNNRFPLLSSGEIAVGRWVKAFFVFYISCNSPFITKKPRKKRNNRFPLLLSSGEIAVSGEGTGL
jgi:hypothetical protein